MQSTRAVQPPDSSSTHRLEARLRQAERIDAVARLAAGVAHDFNNLSMVIMGHSDLLLARTQPDDPRHGHAQEIKKAGERATVLTRQLLSLGGGHGGEPVVLDLNATIAELAQMLRDLIGSNVVIQIQPGVDVSRVLVDRGQIERVLVYLVVNAGDTMPGGGTLTIATSGDDLDAEHFRGHPAGDCEPGRYTVLEVADTGVGVDPITMSHIFEPFYTTKAEGNGTGLELATVYAIVAQIGGFVLADSEPGHGTSFKVYLPAAKAAVTADADGRNSTDMGARAPSGAPARPASA